MGATKEVDAGTVLVTGPGVLERNNVRWIFHVASVIGQPREELPPGGSHRPVREERAPLGEGREVQAGGRDIDPVPDLRAPGRGAAISADHTQVCLTAAVEHLESTDTHVRAVYFYVWGQLDLEICLGVANNLRGLGKPTP